MRWRINNQLGCIFGFLHSRLQSPVRRETSGSPSSHIQTKKSTHWIDYFLKPAVFLCHVTVSHFNHQEITWYRLRYVEYRQHTLEFTEEDEGVRSDMVLNLSWTIPISNSWELQHPTKPMVRKFVYELICIVVNCNTNNK